MSDPFRLLDYVEQPVFVLQPDRHGVPRYVAMNAMALSLLNRLPEEVIGHTAADVFPGHLGQIAFDHHMAVAASGQPITYDLSLPMDGVVQKLCTTLNPMPAPDGQLSHIVGTSFTISGAGSVLLAHMETGMQALTRDVEEFVHLAAQDLRSPMQQVSAIANLLRENFQDLGDGKLDLIDLLEEIGTNALKLIGDVLEYAQGATPLSDREMFDFGNVIDGIIASCAPDKQVQPVAPQALVLMEKSVVQSVLQALVEAVINADPTESKETPTGLDFSVTDAHQGMVDITLSGPGLSPDVVTAISDARLTSEGGFGMAGIHRLIGSRGGMLSVQTPSVNGASSITVLLPGEIAGADPSALYSA